MKNWAVPYERTCRGIVSIEAETAAEAEEIVRSGNFDGDPGEETTDWDLTGRAKEEK